MIKVQTKSQLNPQIQEIVEKMKKFLLWYGFEEHEITETDTDHIELVTDNSVVFSQRVRELVESFILLLGFRVSEYWKFKKYEKMKVYRNDQIKIKINYIEVFDNVMFKKIEISKE